jgi:LysR family transcriptional regulator, glycine cleavage system transcriptional activator
MRRLPPLTALRAFEAAARHLSFRAAAAELGLTPSAISHQIRQLEQLWGMALFRRRPRPLILTEAGRRLFPPIRDVFDGLAAAVADVHPHSERGPLRVTTTNAFASRWLVPRLPLWRRAWPDLALEIIGTDAVLDLRTGEADVAIRYAHAPPRGLECEELCRDWFWPICSPALLAAGPPIKQPADVARYPLVHMHWRPEERNAPTWRRWFQAARAVDPRVPGVGLAGELSFREELHAIEAVVAGQGIAVCSDLLVASELRAGTLVKALELPLPGFGFYLAYTAESPCRSAIAAFGAWARSVV